MKEHKKESSKFWGWMWVFVILAILGVAVYSTVTAPVYVPVTATTTQEVITTNATSTQAVPVTQVITKTIKVNDPALQQQIDQLQATIRALQSENAQLRAQQSNGGSSNNSVIINNPATVPVTVPKTESQLQAIYAVQNPLPNCNDRSRYPITGHEGADCTRDIQNYYINRNTWVNQQLANQ